MKAFLEIDSFTNCPYNWYWLIIADEAGDQTVNTCTRSAFKALFKKHKKQLIEKDRSEQTIKIRFEINLFS